MFQIASRSALASLVLALGSSAASASDIIVGAGGDYATIQAAVDAAANDDLILVRPGTYPESVVIDGKPLWLAATGTVTIQGTLQIANLPAGGSIVVLGFTVNAKTPLCNAGPNTALRVTGNVGHVRIQDCVFQGSAGVEGCGNAAAGGDGAYVSNNFEVALSGSAFRGGLGQPGESDSLSCDARNGGVGLFEQLSSVAAWDCEFRGGEGALCDYGFPAGDGGAAFHSQSFGIFASGCTFRGGDGGDNGDAPPAFAGNGGDGLWLVPGAQAQLLDNVTTGGAAGNSFFQGYDGTPGDPIDGGGPVNQLEGGARLLRGSAIALEGTDLELEIVGEEGDTFYLPLSTRARYVFRPQMLGFWLLPTPAMMSATPLGVIPTSGATTGEYPMPMVPGDASTVRVFSQGFVRSASGQAILAEPFHFLIVNCDGTGPDCNGGGTNDLCDLINGAPDCNGDGSLDECAPDCNGNSVDDACDIAGGASQDTNANGVPDECEPAIATWYVDDSAAPGGDGSQAFPFRTIGEGVAASLSGHTVLVADGTYTGTGNKSLDYSGRDIALRSLNGPASCVIDLQTVGRALRFVDDLDNQAALVEGFTFRNGRAPTSDSHGGAIYALRSSPTIVNCVFDDCRANEGGALMLDQSDSLVRNCTFLNNRALSSTLSGGAIRATTGPVAGRAPRIEICLFIANTSSGKGGAISALCRPAAEIDVSHCVFLQNAATFGGAIWVESGSGSPASAVVARIENSLIADNTAVTGGGGIGSAARLGVDMNELTIAGNHAAQYGGGLGQLGLNGQGLLRNSIVWGNTAPTGAQIALRDSGALLTVIYSDVQGGQPAVDVGAGTGLNWAAGNIDADPLFAGASDWHLSSGSPCIDAGDGLGVPPDRGDLDLDFDTVEPVPVDLEVVPRRVDDPAVVDTGNGPAPVVDIGAYERQP